MHSRAEGVAVADYVDTLMKGYSRAQHCVGAAYKRAAQAEQFAEYLWMANVDRDLARFYLAEFIVYITP